MQKALVAGVALGLVVFIGRAYLLRDDEPEVAVAVKESIDVAQASPTLADNINKELSAEELANLLGMQVWKSRVNDWPDEQITTMTLYAKTSGKSAEKVLTLKPDGPGVILVSLESLGNNKRIARAVFRGEGHSMSRGGEFDDPIKMLNTVNTGTVIGYSGKIILEHGTTTHTRNLEDDEAEAIYFDNK